MHRTIRETVWFILPVILFQGSFFADAKTRDLAGGTSTVERMDVNPKRIGYLVGSSRMNGLVPYLQQKGHTASVLSVLEIQSGILEELDVLIIGTTGIEAIATVQDEIIAWVRGGGTLITVFRSTAYVMNQFGFVQSAVDDGKRYFPSITGGNPVKVQDIAHPLSFRLPGSWLCSGDPIGVYQVLSNLDTQLNIVATLTGDSNADGNLDPIVAECTVDQGHWVAFFCSFDNFSPDTLEYPRVCRVPSGGKHTLEEETLLENAIHIGDFSYYLTVPIDIQPFQSNNLLNPLTQENIEVAIAGFDEDYNIDDLVPSTMRLAGVAPIQSYKADQTNPYAAHSPDAYPSLTCDSILDQQPDGILDLILVFDYHELVTSLQSIYQGMEENQCFPLILTGYFNESYDGLRFLGVDTLKLQTDAHQLRGTIDFSLESAIGDDATVLVRLEDGAPHDVDQIEIYLETDFPFTLELVPAWEGGIIDDWRDRKSVV